MTTQIDHAELERLVAAGGQVIEVLPREEYEQLHLPGARNLPLKELTPDSEGVARLDRARPVVVYCWDGL